MDSYEVTFNNEVFDTSLLVNASSDLYITTNKVNEWSRKWSIVLIPVLCRLLLICFHCTHRNPCHALLGTRCTKLFGAACGKLLLQVVSKGHRL